MPAPEGSKKILLIIGAVLLVLTGLFGFSITKNHRQFAAYKAETLDDPANPPRWETETLSAGECVDAGMTWAMACPGVQSWCLAQLPQNIRTCMATQDRTTYCEEMGDEVMSTRFGFDDCASRREPVGGKYEKRAHKKYCAMSYRAVAGHCQRVREGTL